MVLSINAMVNLQWLPKGVIVPESTHSNSLQTYPYLASSHNPLKELRLQIQYTLVATGRQVLNSYAKLQIVEAVERGTVRTSSAWEGGS